LIDTVHQDAATAGVLDQLATASAIAGELDATGDALLAYFVDQCRRNGHSWTEISGALNVTKQAAHKRFSQGQGQAQPPYERMTPRAHAAIEAAVEAARVRGHNFVGTEHLLFGMVANEASLAAKLLAAKGLTAVDLPATGSELPWGRPIPMTPPAVAALIQSLKESLLLGHNYIGTEHVLLALFQDPEGKAAQLLAEHKITYDDAKASLVQILSTYAS
jgi:ATP-dependent Clp protease ATP-binding subunit ClpA